eukprot:364364-Chlamydomonas_euryale.AAC.8
MAEVDPLESLIPIAVAVVKEWLPDWDVPDLMHPHAKVYVDRDMLLTSIKAGDQIMVKTADGYWHHGIYIGNGRGQHMIVDLWGLDKKLATISARLYSDFVNGAVGFAKAKYPKGVAVDRDASKEFALRAVKWAKANEIVYNAVDCNCEHFATLARCQRWVHAVHHGLEAQLASVPDLPPEPPHIPGFKGI